jgi:hypothetical protein
MSHEINAGNVNEADLGNIMRHKAEVETALGRAYDSAAAIGHELGIHQERSMESWKRLVEKHCFSLKN